MERLDQIFRGADVIVERIREGPVCDAERRQEPEQGALHSADRKRAGSSSKSRGSRRNVAQADRKLLERLGRGFEARQGAGQMAGYVLPRATEQLVALARFCANHASYVAHDLLHVHVLGGGRSRPLVLSHHRKVRFSHLACHDAKYAAIRTCYDERFQIETVERSPGT